MNEIYKSREWLWRRYVMQKKTVTEMAKEAGCSAMTIQRYLEKYRLIKK